MTTGTSSQRCSSVAARRAPPAGRGSPRGRTRRSAPAARADAGGGARGCVRRCRPARRTAAFERPLRREALASRRAPVRPPSRRGRGRPRQRVARRAVADQAQPLEQASGLSSHRNGEGRIPIHGRRSATITTRGASSAKNSRTMNSSCREPTERRAEAAQSIPATSSPGSTAATPRRRSRAATQAAHPAEGSPKTRRRAGAGERSRSPSLVDGTNDEQARHRRAGDAGSISTRPRRRREAAHLHLRRSSVPATIRGPRPGSRPESMRCIEHGTKRCSTSSGSRTHGRAGAPTRAPPGRARGSRAPSSPARPVELARRADELDDPAREERST